MTPGHPRRLRDSLFPISPSAPFGRRGVAVVVAIVVLGTLAQVLRLPADTAYNTIWAEDASVFLNQALNDGIVHSFVIPYQGYIHLLPRLFAALAAVLPLQWAAAVFGIGSAVIVSLLGVLVYRATHADILSPPLRLVLAAMVVLIPVVGFEIEANAANLHFYFDFAAIWALLWRPQGKADRVFAAAVCFLAAASDPLTVLFLPLAIVRLATTGIRRGSSPAFALMAGLLIQAPVILASHQLSLAPNIPLDVAAVFSARVALPFISGGALSDRLWADFQWAVAVLAGLLVVAGFAILAIVRRMRPASLLALLFWVGAVIFAVFPIAGRWQSVMFPHSPILLGIPARYWGAPVLMLWSGVAIVVTSAEVRAWLGEQRRRALVAATIAWLTFILSADFLIVTGNYFRDSGPRWNAQLSGAATKCETGRLSNVSFSVLFDNYIIVLPCDRIRG